MMRAALAIFAIVSLVGCGTTQRQAIADTRAVAQAFQKAEDPAIRERCAVALSKMVLADTADFPDLPKPQLVADEIAKDPAPAEKEADKLATNPPKYDPPPSSGNKSDTHEILTFFGEWCMRVGIGCVILSIVCIVASLSIASVAELLKDKARIIIGVAVGGVLLFLAGMFMDWLGDHLWVLWSSLGIILTLVVVRFRKPIEEEAEKIVHPPENAAGVK